MRLHDYLAERPGRAKAMADHFGVSKAAISQWRDRGAPVDFLRRIVDWTGGDVTLVELLADIEARKATLPATEQSAG